MRFGLLDGAGLEEGDMGEEGLVGCIRVDVVCWAIEASLSLGDEFGQLMLQNLFLTLLSCLLPSIECDLGLRTAQCEFHL